MKARRWWDPAAAGLLAVGLLIACGRLIATEWVDHLTLAYTLAMIGLAAGLALGQSVFHPVLALLFSTLYGLFFVPWQLGRTIGYVAADTLWSDRLVVLVGRLAHTWTRFIQQQPIHDPVLFLFATAVLAWTLGVNAGYALTRRAAAWRVVLPPGLALLLIQTSDLYRPRGPWYLAAYFLFSLLLVARLTFLRLRSLWQADDARIPPLVGLDLSYAMGAVTVLLIFLAWAMPAMADVLPAAKEIWDRATSPLEERSEELFASLRRQGPTITAADYYGEDFALGRGRELSDALVASVQAPIAPSPVRYYWRARIYDRYEGGSWRTEALTITERVDPGAAAFRFPELEGRRSVTFTFTTLDPLMTLYVAPQPRDVSRRALVDFAPNPDGTVDIASVHASPPLGAAEAYAVHSSMPDMTISQLRDAGTDYPAWITERYLELPDTVTPRTRELAREITDGSETPYDSVAAVTRYLRRTIRYSEVITATPPSDQEPLDWFLFDVRTGFCNYYASSAVILLRSLDIPARLAVGFAEGDLQRGTNTYLVYERNAHAWPEVYFPGLGWVEFEPTVSEDPLRRPLGEIETEDEGRLRVPPGGDTEDRWRERLAGLEGMDELGPEDGRLGADGDMRITPRTAAWSSLGLAVAALVFLAWRAGRHWDLPALPVILERGARRVGWEPPAFLRRWAHWTRLSALEKAYAEIDRALLRLGAAAQPADTAAERVASLTRLLPTGSDPANHLLLAYQTAIYSPNRIDLDGLNESARALRRLSWRRRLTTLIGQP